MPRPDDKPKPHIETAFIAIPSPIARDAVLNPSAKLLFGCIYSLSMASTRRCFASNENLACRIGMSVVHVKRLLRILDKSGLIRRRINDSHRVEIEVIWKGGAVVMLPSKNAKKSAKNRGEKVIPPPVSETTPPLYQKRPGSLLEENLGEKLEERERTRVEPGAPGPSLDPGRAGSPPASPPARTKFEPPPDYAELQAKHPRIAAMVKARKSRPEANGHDEG